MKTLIFILLAAISLNAQVNLPIDSLTNKITYAEVVNVDSMSQKVLYDKAREWVVMKFKSANDVIQSDDISKIICKGNFDIYSKKQPAGIINFTIKIEIKDNKYRYQFFDFYHTKGANNEFLFDIGPCEQMIKTKDRTMGISHQKGYNIMLNDMDSRVKSMITSLKSEMSKKVSADW
jgi:hypothetical protein